MPPSKVSHYMNARVLDNGLTVFEVYTPKKQQDTNSAMTAPYGSPSRAGMTVRFQSLNPFEALAAEVDARSNGSGSTGSPTSSGGSLSCIGRNESAEAPVTPSRVQAQGRMLPAMQQIVSIRNRPHQF